MTDTALLRLEAEFNAASDRWDAATDKTAKLVELADRLRSRRERAEEAEQSDADAVTDLFGLIMNTRATTLDGILAKVRARDRWNTDDEKSEVAILQSLVADLEAIAEEQS